MLAARALKRCWSRLARSLSWLLLLGAAALACVGAGAYRVSGVLCQPPRRLAIPAISLDQPIVSGGWQEQDLGSARLMVPVVNTQHPTWFSSSGCVGQRDNMVIFGHSSLNGNPAIFRNLDKLTIGQRIEVYGYNTGSWYVITNRVIIRESGATLRDRIENGKLLGHTETRQLTLVTCWPYPDNTYRLVVIANPGYGSNPK